MNKIKYIILWILLSIHADLYATDAWVLGWVSQEKIRKWDIHIDDIPKIISYAVDYLMWFAATISIIFIIIWGYKIALWSLEWEKSDWKKTIFYALWWFVLAALSWLIFKLIIDNFS